jgi:CheY-like chemotaxis protein
MPKILLVDDNDTFRTAVGMMLEDMGHNVRQATNGEEALALQNDWHAEVLVTDLIMPEKEGLEVIQEFKQRYPEVLIVAMSAGGRMSAPELLKIANHFGASQTLAKPFTKEQLAESIAKVQGSPVS